MKIHFYLPEKAAKLIFYAANFFCIPNINTQQSFTKINGSNDSFCIALNYGESPKYNPNLLLMNEFDDAGMPFVGNVMEDYPGVSFRNFLVKRHIASIQKIFL